MENLEIFGKKYRLQTGFPSEEIKRINREIESRLRALSAEYSKLDTIDVLVLYVLELHEKIFELEKKLKKSGEKLENIKARISYIEEKIREEVKKS